MVTITPRMCRLIIVFEELTEISQRTETDDIRQRVPHINHPTCK